MSIDVSDKQLSTLKVPVFYNNNNDPCGRVVANNNELSNIDFEDPNKVIYLYINGNIFKSITSNILSCTNLVKLYLHDNNIQEVPNDIKKLANLRVLSLESNAITKVSKKVNTLKHLQKLSLYDNKLTKFSINNDSVVNLNLSYNVLSKIKIKGKNIKNLLLSNNRLKKIDATIVKLPSLEALVASSNFISNIPNGINKLKVCKIEENIIST